MENLTTTKLDEDITYDVIGEYYILRIKEVIDYHMVFHLVMTFQMLIMTILQIY